MLGHLLMVNITQIRTTAADLPAKLEDFDMTFNFADGSQSVTFVISLVHFNKTVSPPSFDLGDLVFDCWEQQMFIKIVQGCSFGCLSARSSFAVGECCASFIGFITVFSSFYDCGFDCWHLGTQGCTISSQMWCSATTICMIFCCSCLLPLYACMWCIFALLPCVYTKFLCMGNFATHDLGFTMIPCNFLVVTYASLRLWDFMRDWS